MFFYYGVRYAERTRQNDLLHRRWRPLRKSSFIFRHLHSRTKQITSQCSRLWTIYTANNISTSYPWNVIWQWYVGLRNINSVYSGRKSITRDRCIENVENKVKQCIHFAWKILFSAIANRCFIAKNILRFCGIFLCVLCDIQYILKFTTW